MSKVNLMPVLRGHLSTLYDNRDDSTSLQDLAIFFVLPAIVAGCLDGVHFGYRVDAVNGFLNAFAILTGLLLNLLVLVFTLATTTSVTNVDFYARKAMIKEVFRNVCFCVVIAVLLVVTAVTALSYMRSIAGAESGPVATFLLTFLGLLFVLTLAMIVKRMYVHMNKELENVRPPVVKEMPKSNQAS